MIFVESIYFLILFTLPAALHIVYHAHIRKTPKINNDKSVELAECIIFCLCVFFINFLIFNNKMKYFAEYLLADNKFIYCKENQFNYIDFIVNYFIINLFVSIGTIFIWYAILIKLYRYVNNKINTLLGRPTELPFPDVWKNVFETNKYVDVKECAVRIEKAGKLVNAGIIAVYPAPHVEHRELLLHSTDLIKYLFEKDKNKHLNKKIFPYSLYEYYDIENDLLIKFYSLEGFDRYNERKGNKPG